MTRKIQICRAAATAMLLLLALEVSRGDETRNARVSARPPRAGSKGDRKPTPPPVLPPRSDFSKRVGIVYSDTTAKRFYSKFAYLELFLAMQHQAMMAGIPFDLLREEDLTNINNLVNYDALLFPSALNVSAAKSDAIAAALYQAVYHYRIGLITAGDFFTLDEKNQGVEAKPYQLIRQLFGLQKISDVESVPVRVTAEATDHPIMRDYDPEEVIYTSPRNSVVAYGPVPGQSFTVLAQMKAGNSTYPAMVATETGGRNVYFADTQLIGVCNLVWPALQWVLYGDQPAVGLKLTRSKSLFAARNDMDQSRFIREIARVEEPLYDLIEDWKTRYNFVGSFFLNTGNNPAAGEYTDWRISAPLYRKFMDLGNEIGTHTTTHPDNVNRLTAAQLEFEFKRSKEEIEAQLGIKVHGTAIPGADEKLSVDQRLEQYGFEYISGRYSNAGAGYPGAFGYLTPGFETVYFGHSFESDFGLIQFKKMNAVQARADWQREYAGLMRHAAQPIIHWMWHDYGPLASPTFGYDLEMYQGTVEMAFEDETEFATMIDVRNRIQALQNARMLVTPGEPLIVQVSGDGLGKFPLKIRSDNVIASVDGWYAYNRDSVFVPATGGVFAIHLGEQPLPRTHLVSLPMRANLTAVSGDGGDLSFGFDGEGWVEIAVYPEVGASVYQEGADGAELNDGLVRLRFDTAGAHSARVWIQ